MTQDNIRYLSARDGTLFRDGIFKTAPDRIFKMAPAQFAQLFPGYAVVLAYTMPLDISSSLWMMDFDFANMNAITPTICISKGFLFQFL